MSTVFPPVAFHFRVAFDALNRADHDWEFQEVTGIGSEMELETVREGGENRYVLQLPKGAKSTRLTLKRGVAAVTSPLTHWCRRVFEGGLAQRITPRLIHVYLLNENRDPLRAWSFDHAFPVKWSVAGFDATRNALALESIEFSYLQCLHDQVGG